MAKRTFLLVSLLILAFVASSYLIFATILKNIERNDRESQLQMLADTSSQIELSYQLINRLLVIRQEKFRKMHELTLSLMGDGKKKIDLAWIQKFIEFKAGIPVDVYIIGPDLKIEESTYPPDVGLDFNAPPFVDVQYFLREAKRQNRIMVGQPSPEFVSKRIKIYTYSELGDDRYLELGFIDPEIDGYFQTLIQSLKQRSDVQVQLFFELWNTLLAPLVQTPLKEFTDKNALLKQHQEVTRGEYEIFRKVIGSDHPYKLESTNHRGDPVTTYYTQITGLAPEMLGNIEMRFLARVTFNNSKIVKIKEQFLFFFWMALLLALLGLAGLAYTVRSWFIRPLNLIVAAIENKQLVDLRRLPKSSVEFSEIAETYNQTLAHLRKNMEELKWQSIIDPLTGIQNRRNFYTIFGQEVGRSARTHTSLALAMIDLDHFKTYNDRHGHQQGDQLLNWLADYLQRRFLRPSDHICRMGGDEFSVLLSGIDPATVEHVFEELKDGWHELVATKEHDHQAPTVVSISIGVYICTGSSGTSWKDAYAQADEALYEAKDKGRSRVVIRRPSAQIFDPARLRH